MQFASAASLIWRFIDLLRQNCFIRIHQRTKIPLLCQVKYLHVSLLVHTSSGSLVHHQGSLLGSGEERTLNVKRESYFFKYWHEAFIYEVK